MFFSPLYSTPVDTSTPHGAKFVIAFSILFIFRPPPKNVFSLLAIPEIKFQSKLSPVPQGDPNL